MTSHLWMPPMKRVLELEKLHGITGGSGAEAVVRLGDIGVAEHLIHELGHAMLLDIVVDEQTRHLSNAVASELHERYGNLDESRGAAINETETFAVESLVVERLGLPIAESEILDGLAIQVAHSLDDYEVQYEDMRCTGHVAEIAERICKMLAPDGRPELSPRLEGAVFTRIAENGLEITVYPMLLGNARLCIGEEGDVCLLNAWCYQTDQLGDGLIKAIAGAAEWNGEGDDPPGGWYRNPMTGRRRPGGDPSKEARWA
jgi:hypothetical protein